MLADELRTIQERLTYYEIANDSLAAIAKSLLRLDNGIHDRFVEAQRRMANNLAMASAYLHGPYVGTRRNYVVAVLGELEYWVDEITKEES